jgi:hypothetical protein
MWTAVGNKLLQLLLLHTPQRQNTENSKQIFPEKELTARPESQCDYIFPGSVHIFSCSRIGTEDRSWEHTNCSQTHECRNWDWGHAIPFLGIHKWDFLTTWMSFYTSSKVVTPKWIFSTFTRNLKLRTSHVRTAGLLGGRRSRCPQGGQRNQPHLNTRPTAPAHRGRSRLWFRRCNVQSADDKLGQTLRTH